MKQVIIRRQWSDRRFIFIVMPGNFYKPDDNEIAFGQFRKRRSKFLDCGIYWDMQQWKLTTPDAIFGIYQTPTETKTKKNLNDIGITVFDEAEVDKFAFKINSCKQAPYLTIRIRQQDDRRNIEINEFRNELMLMLYQPLQAPEGVLNPLPELRKSANEELLEDAKKPPERNDRKRCRID